MGFWDPYAGDRYKFESAGDTIEGTITRLHTTDFGDGPVPVLTIATDGGNKEITASQSVLQSRLAQHAPEEGDWVKITYDGPADKARPGRSPAKLFTVVVKRAGADAPPPPQTELPDAWSDDPF